MNLPATLPPGPAPTIPTLRGEFAKRDNLIAEATRRGPVGPGGAYCRVHLTVDVAMSAAVDYLAYGNWVADNDDRGMYTPGGSTKATITIPATGVWLIHYHAIYMGSATDSTGIDYIINNGTSIARDAKRYANAGNDGTPVDAWRIIPLSAGDVLTWGNWSASAVTLKSSVLAMPTEITVQQLSG